MSSAIVDTLDVLALRVLTLLVVGSAHAAAWAAVAALMVRSAAPRASVARALWKLALLGPLSTTALSMVWPSQLRLGGEWLTTTVARHGHVVSSAASADAHASAWIAEALSLRAALALLVLAGCALGVARFGASVRALRRLLAGRVVVRDARLIARFSLLRARVGLAHVTLTESAYAPGPLVLGRREICVPAGLLAAFRDDEIDAVLAHELAHLARADGLWFPVVALVEALLWMQPLSGWLARRFRHSAELAADDDAVALTRAPMALARAITRMAAAQFAQRDARLVPAMATASARVQRVQRLVQSALPELRTRGARWPLPCLGVLALVLPSVGADVTSLRASPRTGAIAAAAGVEIDARRARMAALAKRGSVLATELAAAQYESSADPGSLMELEQELRHLRAMQAWLEAGSADARVAAEGMRAP